MPEALLPLALTSALAAQADWSQRFPVASPSPRTEVQMVSAAFGLGMTDVATLTVGVR